MNRRHALFAGGSIVGALLSGCLSRTSESATPEYDCNDANRPPEPASDDEPPGEGGRYIYPQHPESLSDESGVLSYVEAYERAYRLNNLFSEHRANLNHASIFIRETWTYEAPEGAAIARLKCRYSYGVTQDDSQMEADSPIIYASYYIDEAVVLRKAVRGRQDDESKLVPDPMEAGIPTECF